eukprot:TRINITY_DN2618_c0_g1_i1.p1 TRINITY_DN2618_c0_g1~~TRINITY_DN2618_c0_g1_i1.p1  ORF type:complete len:108 (+),score=9.44 TRINITY_DN2618_c0_g1_i1:88-411(+)
MNNIVCRPVSRSVTRNVMNQLSKRRSHDDTLLPEDAMKDLRLWKTSTAGGVSFVFIYLLWVRSRHHVEEEKPAYPYLNLRGKPLPWGDGDTSLFDYIFKKDKHGHHH